MKYLQLKLNKNMKIRNIQMKEGKRDLRTIANDIQLSSITLLR